MGQEGTNAPNVLPLCDAGLVGEARQSPCPAPGVGLERRSGFRGADSKTAEEHGYKITY